MGFGDALLGMPQDMSARQYQEDGGDDADAPLSMFEWLIGGGVLVALWCYFVSRHQRRMLLQMMPVDLWREYSEYVVPISLIISPFYCGNVSFRDAGKFMRQALKEGRH